MEAAHKLVHLPSRGERTFIHDIKALLPGIHFLSLGKMGLQCLCLNAGLAELLRCARCRCKAFYPIPRILSTLAHDGQSRRLSRTRDPIQANNLLSRQKHLIYCLPLSSIQLQVTFLGINARSPVYQHGIGEAALVAVFHVAYGFALHAKRLRRRVLLPFMLRPMLDSAKLPRLRSAVELLPDLREAGLAHAPVERRRQNRPPALYRRTLEEMFTGVGH